MSDEITREKVAELRDRFVRWWQYENDYAPTMQGARDLCDSWLAMERKLREAQAFATALANRDPGARMDWNAHEAAAALLVDAEKWRARDIWRDKVYAERNAAEAERDTLRAAALALAAEYHKTVDSEWGCYGECDGCCFEEKYAPAPQEPQL